MKRHFLLVSGLVALLAAACSTEPVIEEPLATPVIVVENLAAATPTPFQAAAIQPTVPPTVEVAAAQPATATPTPSITPTATEAPYVSSLPNLGPAPELENEVWLNTENPLRLADLRGQVVLLDMWTFD